MHGNMNVKHEVPLRVMFSLLPAAADHVSLVACAYVTTAQDSCQRNTPRSAEGSQPTVIN
jgi:hypothetical protein